VQVAVCTNIFALARAVMTSASISKYFWRESLKCTGVFLHFRRLNVIYKKTKKQKNKKPERERCDTLVLKLRKN
jgi:hypothetical protein